MRYYHRWAAAIDRKGLMLCGGSEVEAKKRIVP
jgi:hypothetical protein